LTKETEQILVGHMNNTLHNLITNRNQWNKKGKREWDLMPDKKCATMVTPDTTTVMTAET